MFGRRGRHAQNRRALKTIGVIGTTVALLVGALALAGYAYARTTSDHLLPGVRVEGVAVGGMTRAQAISAVQAAVNDDLSRKVTVSAAGRTWTTTAAALGVRADVAAAVDDAFAASNAAAWPVSVYDRLTHHPLDHSVEVALSLPTDQTSGYIKQISSAVNRAPVSASISLTGDRVVFQRARAGRALQRAAAANALSQALRSGQTTVSLPVVKSKPKVTARSLGKTITVDLSTNTLHLYKGFNVIRTFPVATARPGFTTPIGEWKVVAKEFMPAWYNPAPHGWAAGMPAYIPPGPGNPLGLRALGLNASGIFIHGTPEDYSIGTYASHGCIRMHETDAIALFPLVPQGTPVVIYGAPPWGNSSSTAPAGF